MPRNILNLDEIASQIDGTVPYYVLPLLRELRAAREVVAAATDLLDQNEDDIDDECEEALRFALKAYAEGSRTGRAR